MPLAKKPPVTKPVTNKAASTKAPAPLKASESGKPKELKPKEAPKEEKTNDASSLKRIRLEKLLDTISPILTSEQPQKTPLIIDPSGKADVFFTYGGGVNPRILDAKKYAGQVLIAKIMTADEALEEMRQSLVNSLKWGNTLVISLQDTALAFKSTFTSPKAFPVNELLQNCGRKFLEEAQWSHVVREQDKEPYGVFVPHQDFRVLVTSQFDLEDYEEFLQDSIPLEHFIPIYIEPK